MSRILSGAVQRDEIESHLLFAMSSWDTEVMSREVQGSFVSLKTLDSSGTSLNSLSSSDLLIYVSPLNLSCPLVVTLLSAVTSLHLSAGSPSFGAACSQCWPYQNVTQCFVSYFSLLIFPLSALLVPSGQRAPHPVPGPVGGLFVKRIFSLPLSSSPCSLGVHNYVRSWPCVW